MKQKQTTGATASQPSSRDELIKRIGKQRGKKQRIEKWLGVEDADKDYILTMPDGRKFRSNPRHVYERSFGERWFVDDASGFYRCADSELRAIITDLEAALGVTLRDGKDHVWFILRAKALAMDASASLSERGRFLLARFPDDFERDEETGGRGAAKDASGLKVAGRPLKWDLQNPVLAPVIRDIRAKREKPKRESWEMIKRSMNKTMTPEQRKANGGRNLSIGQVRAAFAASKK